MDYDGIGWFFIIMPTAVVILIAALIATIIWAVLATNGVVC